MTANDFILHFPEFRDTDRLIVGAKLSQAAARMGGPDQSVWGAFSTATPATQNTGPTQGGGPTVPTIADLAQGNYAAHLLISSPFGTEMRLEPGNGKSSYLEEFERLEQAVAGGFITTGIG